MATKKKIEPAKPETAEPDESGRKPGERVGAARYVGPPGTSVTASKRKAAPGRARAKR
jgi:hypothetical protein